MKTVFDGRHGAHIELTKPNNEWDEKFDWTMMNDETHSFDEQWHYLGNFISKTLQQQREEILEEIESNYLMPNGGIELQYLEWEQFKEENK